VKALEDEQANTCSLAEQENAALKIHLKKAQAGCAALVEAIDMFIATSNEPVASVQATIKARHRLCEVRRADNHGSRFLDAVKLLEDIANDLEYAPPNTGASGYLFVPKDQLARLLAWRRL
jgi:hypothetical protein